MNYLFRTAAWLSQGINCVLLNGSPDQTVSARAYLNRNTEYWGKAYTIINLVFFWQEDHCRESHEADLAFARQILGYQ